MSPKFVTVDYLKKLHANLKFPFLINRGTNLEKFGEFAQDKRTEGATPGGRSPSQGAPCLNP